MNSIQKPEAGEYPPYALDYIRLVPDDGLLLKHLADNLEAMQTMTRAMSAEHVATPCAEGEWTVKEILGHVMDTERVMCYRAMRIARGDTTPLPGFDHDTFVTIAGANARSLEDILEEYAAVRHATMTFLASLDETALFRSGTASNHPLSARGAAYFLAGHELHHIHSIRENYG